MKIKDIWQHIKFYFDLMAEKENEKAVIDQVSNGVVFRGTNLWILMFAILIASLGLNVNSTAVIIGAMLISPLMGPIIGMGLAVGINDFDLLKRALKNYLIATLISVVTATIYFLLSPLSEAHSELLARTSPTLYDVLIAFFGGAAGVLALTTKSKGQVIPGVAIATALMPPLCTAGYGLATGHWQYFLGAFYLFFINTIFIAVSTFLGVKLLRFHTVSGVQPDRVQYGRRIITIAVIITLIPAGIMTTGIIRKEVRDRNIASFVKRELERPGRQILNKELLHDTLYVVTIGHSMTEAELNEAQQRLTDHGLKGLTLSVIQGYDQENVEALTRQLSGMATAADAERVRMVQQVADLQRQLDAYSQYDTLSVRVTDEAAHLFSAPMKIRLGRACDYTVAIVELSMASHPKDELDRITAWLRTRLQNDSLRVIFF